MQKDAQEWQVSLEQHLLRTEATLDLNLPGYEDRRNEFSKRAERMNLNLPEYKSLPATAERSMGTQGFEP